MCILHSPLRRSYLNPVHCVQPYCICEMYNKKYNFIVSNCTSPLHTALYLNTCTPVNQKGVSSLYLIPADTYCYMYKYVYCKYNIYSHKPKR